MEKQPAKVTKSYAYGLVGAVIILASALLIASWGLVGLYTGEQPVTTADRIFAAPFLIILALIGLGFLLWRQTIWLLRGNKPLWSLLIVTAGATYLFWALGGIAVGLSVKETWLSPFAVLLAVIWALVLAIFWGVLLRKLYSDSSGVPKWPWEDRDERERRGEED